ncbi:MAG: penicillin-binding protein 2 [Paludibacteraceae bacterium]|nr:penicillin-binding protein 2 [Paludibacteraceae bacterium]
MITKKDQIVIRFAVIFITLTVAASVVIISKIWKVQHNENEELKWSKIEKSQVRTNQPVEPMRGNIYDANRQLLASSLPEYIVRMDTRVEALHLKNDSLFKRYIDSISIGLSNIIGDKSPQEYKKIIKTAFYSEREEVKYHDIRLHKGRINYLQKKEIEQLPLINRGVYKSGVYFTEQHVRVNPYGDLGRRAIGTTDKESGQGDLGLEYSFNDVLTGTPGVATYMRVAGRQSMVPVKDAIDGCDVITTLDVNLMDICEKTLRSKIEAVEGDWGCVILMEAHSGQIKAMVNLDRQSDGTYAETNDHTIKRVEPGSTFKTIAMMAAIDEGRIQIDDTFRITVKPWEYHSLKHTDSHKKDTVLTARSALAISSNIALAKMIVKAYHGDPEPFIQKLEKMGLTQGFYSELPKAHKPKIAVPDNKVTISKMAYGYSVELSPLQIMAFYNGIANDGKMIRPYLVSRIERDGVVLQEFDTETISTLCSASTLRDIRGGLHDVVWDNNLPGTAAPFAGHNKAQSELVHIAGKTGTAQLLLKNEFNRWEYQSRKHRMTFVGYFPEEDPQYTCICMIEHPKSMVNGVTRGYDAGRDCGEVVRKIAEQTIAYSWVYEIENGQKIFKKR